MSKAGKIIELRALIQRHQQAPPMRRDGQLATGVSQLDTLLDGGLCKGGIVELVSERWSSGGTSLLLAILRHAALQQRWSALIDGSDSFDPQGAGPEVLANLLWIRCRGAAEAMRSADLLLRDGNLPLIFLDLRGNGGTELRKIPDPTWYRLQRAIEPTSSTMIALTPRVLIASAHARLIVEGHFDLQALHREPAENLREIKLRVTRKRTNHGIPIPSGLAEAG
jgi:hypothetical protein